MVGPDHHELAHPGRRPIADRAALEHRRGVPGVWCGAAPPALRDGLLEGPGRRQFVPAGTEVGEGRAPRALLAAGDPARVPAQGCPGLLPRYDPVEPADPARRAPPGLRLQYPGAAALL